MFVFFFFLFFSSVTQSEDYLTCKSPGYRHSKRWPFLPVYFFIPFWSFLTSISYLHLCLFSSRLFILLQMGDGHPTKYNPHIHMLSTVFPFLFPTFLSFSLLYFHFHSLPILEKHIQYMTWKHKTPSFHLITISIFLCYIPSFLTFPPLFLHPSFPSLPFIFPLLWVTIL